MGENSKIEWTDHTFNPWVGCAKVSEACRNCYAESWAKRTGQADLWRGERRRTTPANWRKPLKWSAEAEAAGVRARVFCASLADVFELVDCPGTDPATDVAAAMYWWREDLWALIRATPWLDWLMLTKRPENIAGMLPEDWGDDGYHNVWLGVTAENQKRWDERHEHLLSVPARVHFVSVEPMGSAIDMGLTRPTPHRLGWVIAGGESGPKATAAHPDWFRGLRDQCDAAGVPFLFKQWGEWAPKYSGPTMWRVGKAAAGRHLDGVLHDGFPVPR